MGDRRELVYIRVLAQRCWRTISEFGPTRKATWHTYIAFLVAPLEVRLALATRLARKPAPVIARLGSAYRSVAPFNWPLSRHFNRQAPCGSGWLMVVLGLLQGACPLREPDLQRSESRDTNSAPSASPLPEPSAPPPGSIERRFGSFADVGPLVHDDRQVVGHVLIRHFGHLAAELQTTLLDGPSRALLAQPSLRTMLAAQLGRRAGLAFGVDFNEPMGCVLARLPGEGLAYACFFAYRGGTQQMVQDLGLSAAEVEPRPRSTARRKRLTAANPVPAADTRPVLPWDDEALYVDVLGSHTVVSSGKSTFFAVKSYLETNMLGRREAVYGDVEVVVFTGDLLDAQRAVFDEAIDSVLYAPANRDRRKGKSEWPEPLASRLANYRRQATQFNLRRLADFDQVHLSLAFDTLGLRVGALAIPKAGTATQADTRAIARVGGERSALLAVPAPAIAAATDFISPEQWIDDPSNAALLELVTSTWGSMTASKPEIARAALLFALREHASHHEPFIALSWHRSANSPFLLAFSQTIREGQEEAANLAFARLASTVQPQQVFGRHAERYLTWTYHPQAEKIGSIPVDRLVFVPGSLLLKALDRRFGSRWRQRWEERHGPLALVFERLAVGRQVVCTLALNPQPEFLQQVAAAAGGDPLTPTLAGTKGITTILQEHPNATSTVGLEVYQLLQWLAQRDEQAFGREAASLDPGSLADVFFSSQVHADGRAAGQLVLGRAFLLNLAAASRRSSQFISTVDASSSPP